MQRTGEVYFKVNSPMKILDFDQQLRKFAKDPEKARRL